MSKAKGVHVSFADVNSEKSESFESSWGGRRDYGAIAKQADQSSHHHHVKHKRRVTFFGNKPSLTIDFGLFAFSSSQRDIIWYSFYCFLYISLAVVAFSFLFEKWSIVDSIYFATTTFTTTGFGDKVPSTDAGRLFTTVFALYGIIMLGIFVGIVGYAIGKAQYKEIKKLKAESRQSVLHRMFPQHAESMRLLRGESPEDRAALVLEGNKSVLEDVKEVSTKAFPLLLAVVILACILGALEGWSMSSSLYFCIITATTTGYGDYVPTTEWTKVYCILFVPFAVSVFANTLGRIATIYIRRKNRMAERKFMRRSITLCDLRAMDANDDGMVSMEEFISFMLVALQKVDKELLDELRAVFRSLDTNENGMLEKDDLIAHSTRDWDSMEVSGDEEIYERQDDENDDAPALPPV
mmetsp:Transcript_1590/g.2852  ORF Transcript_1590/g.2852 Transcript_1590/m.2852 type:complete len:410 (+) Transcript_1590:127-1356(+)